MFNKSSLTARVAVGKSLGLVFGLIGFICLPNFLPDASSLLRWGILLWYITLGAIVGMFGVYTYHPILKFSLPWWFRGVIMGGWMNFVLVFFAYDVMQAMMISLFGESGMLSSPFWFVLEGAIIGLIIDFVATKIAGEGKAIVEE